MNREQAERTIGYLGGALSEALSMITQLFLHASILKAQSHPLARRCYREWVETMRRSDRILESILELGGRPSCRQPSDLELGREPARIFELDVALVERWIAFLEGAAADCASAGSDGAAATLRALGAAELRSLDWRRSERGRPLGRGEEATTSPSIEERLAECLNGLLRTELSAITQVYYHGQLFEAWGAEALGTFMTKETWEKTWRSLELTDRMLAGGVHPNGDGHGVLHIGSSTREILDHDGALVRAQLALLEHSLELCDKALHPEIHEMLCRMRTGERSHADWIASQMERIAGRETDPSRVPGRSEGS